MSWLITGTEKNPVDLSRSNVSLLLHGDGTNGSTTITDSSPLPKTMTAFGNAQISTTQSKFGGASFAFDGSGDYLLSSSDSTLAPGSGDFTWEAWIYISGGNTYRQVFSNRSAAFNFTTAGSLAVNPTNGLTWYTDGFIVNYTTSIGTNQWIHVAVTRSGTQLKVFANGAQVGSTATNSQNLTDSIISVGANRNGSETFNGYIDEVRITKGVARYTANFTPPTAAFPDI